MEYTFKNSVASKACTVTLEGGFMSIQRANAGTRIRYEEISAVRLSRAKGKRFLIYIHSDHQKPVVISNGYHLTSSDREDRSRQYSTFVRVLHMHLQNNKRVRFSTGFSPEWFFRTGTALIASAALVLLCGVLVFRSRLSVVGLILITMAATTAIAALTNRHLFPKSYEATNIPLNFLP